MVFANTQERFFMRPTRAFWFGLALLAVVAVGAIVVPAEPFRIDRAWSEAMQDIQTPLLDHVALVFNALGRGLLRAISLAGVGIVLLLARRWLALMAFAVVEALTPLISTALKSLVERPRPPEALRPPDALLHPTHASFPSGHAAYAGATCIALVVLFTAPRARRTWWWGLAIAGIGGMAWSRTYLQVHWLSDVVVGSLLGAGISFVVFGAAQWLVAERPKARSDAEPHAPT